MKPHLRNKAHEEKLCRSTKRWVGSPRVVDCPSAHKADNSCSEAAPASVGYEPRSRDFNRPWSAMGQSLPVLITVRSS